MPTEIRVPTLGESVTEATVAEWYKKPGDAVDVDEAVCGLETEKVTLEVPAPAAGVLTEQAVAEGDTVEPNGLLGIIDETATAATATKAGTKPDVVKPEPEAPPPTAAAPAKPAPAPAASSGGGARIAKGTMLADADKPISRGGGDAPLAVPTAPRKRADREERVRMTRLRKTIARRLKDAQSNAAMLTTFNEVDLGEVMGLRKKYRDEFEKKHGVRLGFMSFFVKACVHALQEIPAVNAEIEGDDIVYKNYYDIGVAVGTPNGLVVPVVKDCEAKGFAELERTIGDLGVRARDGKLGLADLQGGTFTISNGGVYGSLMSTPILNPPQSGILGMHKIQERPMVVNGEIQIRPMMYLALSYDHRIIDGKEAVTFLVRVKECLEDPDRMLVDL